MIALICYVALGLSVLSFLVFLLSAAHAAWIANKAVATSTSAAEAANRTVRAQAATQNMPSVSDLTELIKALTGAIDAVRNAGPSLAGLVASIVFLGIAAWAAASGHPTP